MEKNRKLLLIGGGGHCKSVIDSLVKTKLYTEIGIIDIEKNIRSSVLGIPVVGCDDDLPRLYQKGYSHAFITVGSIGSPAVRVKLFNIIKDIGFIIPDIIDESAVVSENASIKEGVYVGKNAVINAGSNVEKCAIINTGSIVEHDCVIGQFCHISPGSVLCGEVQVGDYTHIGAGSVVKQQIRIGKHALIGMGSVVLKDISDNVTAYGNPCREVM